MTELSIRLWPHPDLKKKALPVDVKNDVDFRSQLEQMRQLCVKRQGAGLAAPQVGLLKRMLVTSRFGKQQLFVNPTIAGFTGEWISMVEGCLSLPGFYEKVKRNTSVVVSYYNPQTGIEETTPFEGLMAHILQHEIEHLDGIVFVDKLKPAQRDQLRSALRKNVGKAGVGVFYR